MNKIGIIAAMNEELVYLRSFMKVETSKNVLDTDFYTGNLFGKNVVLARSGIGKVNAASCAQYIIDLYNVDCVINVGAAGAIKKDLNIGDVVIADDLVQYDFDASAFGDALGIIPRMRESFFKCDKNFLEIAKKFADKSSQDDPSVNYFVGRVASGDKFISSEADKKFIIDNFNACCAEMEGAAVAQVCFINKIPFIALRTITDNASESAIGYYKKFMSSVTRNTTEIIKYILSEC